MNKKKNLKNSYTKIKKVSNTFIYYLIPYI